ncbi:unnamed protein product, partial [marine sediment metagenome]
MKTVNGKVSEKALYEPIREYLAQAFQEKFGNCHLETTANGVFSGELKRVVRHDIIFSFLGKKASPDLTGFIHRAGSDWIVVRSPSDIQDLITVEIKPEKITIQDIYQAKMYGDLFQAKYALLVSPDEIPEEIRRLDKQIMVTYRYMGGSLLYIGRWVSSVYGLEINAVEGWLPRSP